MSPSERIQPELKLKDGYTQAICPHAVPMHYKTRSLVIESLDPNKRRHEI